MQFSLNPLTMAGRLCGPQFKKKFAFALVCALLLGLAIYFAVAFGGSLVGSIVGTRIAAWVYQLCILSILNLTIKYWLSNKTKKSMQQSSFLLLCGSVLGLISIHLLCYFVKHVSHVCIFVYLWIWGPQWEWSILFCYSCYWIFGILLNWFLSQEHTFELIYIGWFYIIYTLWLYCHCRILFCKFVSSFICSLFALLTLMTYSRAWTASWQWSYWHRWLSHILLRI